MRQPTHPRKRTHIPSNRWDKLSSSPNHSHFPGPTERKKNKEGSGFRLVMNALPKKKQPYSLPKKEASAVPPNFVVHPKISSATKWRFTGYVTRFSSRGRRDVTIKLTMIQYELFPGYFVAYPVSNEYVTIRTGGGRFWNDSEKYWFDVMENAHKFWETQKALDSIASAPVVHPPLRPVPPSSSSPIGAPIVSALNKFSHHATNAELYRAMDATSVGTVPFGLSPEITLQSTIAIPSKLSATSTSPAMIFYDVPAEAITGVDWLGGPRNGSYP